MYIAHRGNMYGPCPEKENSPAHIQDALDAGFDAEVDVWGDERGLLHLGHDGPQYPVDLDFLMARASRLWIHAKNMSALEALLEHPELHVFSHDADPVVLTSKRVPWVYPGAPMGRGGKGVRVMPERVSWGYEEEVGLGTGAMAVCSDFVGVYRRRAETGKPVRRVALFVSGRLSCERERLIPQVLAAIAPGGSLSDALLDVYVSTNEDIGDRLRAIAPLVMGVQCVPYTAPPEYIHHPRKATETNAQHTMSMFYHNMRAFQMIERRNEYDVVIKFRPDIVSPRLPNVGGELEPGCMYVPSGSDHSGLNDQVAYGDMAAMRAYTGVFPAIDAALAPGTSCQLHPESLLAHHMKGRCVRRFHYSYGLDDRRK